MSHFLVDSVAYPARLGPNGAKQCITIIIIILTVCSCRYKMIETCHSCEQIGLLSAFEPDVLLLNCESAKSGQSGILRFSTWHTVRCSSTPP
jgi:hypothetical protein